MRPDAHISGIRAGSLFLCIAILCLFPISSAFAAGTVGDTLCWIYNYTLGTSGIGKGIATLGVVALALGAMFGKATWGMAITVAVGIAGLFGAWSLYASLFPGSGSC